MREHRLDHLLRVALLAQDRRAVLRMLVERGVDLVVEVVEQSGHAPELLVLAELARVPRGRGLDGERVAQERLALRVRRQRFPGLVAGRHGGVSIVRFVSSTIVRPAAESFVIEGGHPLSGRMRASGNKNGALPILAACLLTDEPVDADEPAAHPRRRDDDGPAREPRRRRRVDRPERGAHPCAGDLARAGRPAREPDPRVLPARRPAARASRSRERAAAGRRRDRSPPARPAHPCVRRARRGARSERALRAAADGCRARTSTSTRRR